LSYHIVDDACAHYTFHQGLDFQVYYVSIIRYYTLQTMSNSAYFMKTVIDGVFCLLRVINRHGTRFSPHNAGLE